MTHAGLIAGILLFLGQLSIRRHNAKSLLLTALFFCLSFLLFNSLLFQQGLLLNYSFFIFSHVPFLYAIGPLIYYFYRWNLKKNPKEPDQPIYWLHFLAPVLALLILIPFYFSETNYKSQIITQLLTKKNFDFPAKALIFISILGTCTIVGYLVSVFISGHRLIQWKLLGKEVSLRILFLIMLVSLLASIFLPLTYFLRDTVYLKISSSLLSCILFYVFIASRRNPEFLALVNEVILNQKYARSHLQDMDKPKLQRQLEQLMSEDKIYLNEDLTLIQVANLLQISSHQLSEFLNDYLKISYYNYINKLRIDAAIEQLKNDSDASILDIAFAVGFNSKSAFNKAFKKVTGQTPSEFRRVVK